MSIIIPANTLAAGGFNIDNSCRFNDASPDILKNGTESDGNRKVWTISMWIKRSKLGVRQSLWSWGSNSSSTGELYIDANDFLVLNNDGHQGSSNEVAGVLRDISAWYHIVWRCDVTESNNIDRWRCYINGVQRLLTDAASVSNADGEINKNGTHQNWIGGAARSLQSGNAVYPFGGYIAEAVFIDGQALAPTSFGEFDEDSGIWKPIDVSGLTFGDEGVYLNFQNASELGTDVSGNGNTYAETGLAAIDQATDTCTNNFATFNSLSKNDSGTVAFSEGNLYTAHSGSDSKFNSYSTIGVASGKWYAEFKFVASSGGTDMEVGVGYDVEDANRLGKEFGYTAGSYDYNAYGNKHNDSNESSYGDSYGVGDIIGVALDLDNHKLYFSKNSTWQASGDPESGATGTNAAFSLTTGETYFIGAVHATATSRTTDYAGNYGGCSAFAISSGNTDGNGFGNFEYAPPSGYFALCTKNLAEYG